MDSREAGNDEPAGDEIGPDEDGPSTDPSLIVGVGKGKSPAVESPTEEDRSRTRRESRFHDFGTGRFTRKNALLRLDIERVACDREMIPGAGLGAPASPRKANRAGDGARCRRPHWPH